MIRVITLGVTFADPRRVPLHTPSTLGALRPTPKAPSGAVGPGGVEMTAVKRVMVGVLEDDNLLRCDWVTLDGIDP